MILLKINSNHHTHSFSWKVLKKWRSQTKYVLIKKFYSINLIRLKCFAFVYFSRFFHAPNLCCPNCFYSILILYKACLDIFSTPRLALDSLSLAIEWEHAVYDLLECAFKMQKVKLKIYLKAIIEFLLSYIFTKFKRDFA